MRQAKSLLPYVPVEEFQRGFSLLHNHGLQSSGYNVKSLWAILGTRRSVQSGQRLVASTIGGDATRFAAGSELYRIARQDMRYSEPQDRYTLAWCCFEWIGSDYSRFREKWYTRSGSGSICLGRIIAIIYRGSGFETAFTEFPLHTSSRCMASYLHRRRVGKTEPSSDALGAFWRDESSRHFNLRTSSSTVPSSFGL